ncbi:uncharacterized protein LOC141815924 [Curcuma longa]|uniref:uncharacterized protein LOC141815924 n=1 Tax=Curcuma longa TaxID=136217 RepID=UPI003D9EBF57
MINPKLGGKSDCAPPSPSSRDFIRAASPSSFAKQLADAYAALLADAYAALVNKMEWDNSEADDQNFDAYEENNSSSDESSDDEAFINRNCAIVLWMVSKDMRKYIDRGLIESNDQKDNIRRILLHNLMTSTDACHSILRMSLDGFRGLCEILKQSKRVKDNRNSSVEEKVAKFLYLLGHDVKNRELSFFFRRSTRTTSNHFHEVLKAIIGLHAVFIKQPDGAEIPPLIESSNRFYPYFKDCVGALDGTHIRVKVSDVDAPRYRGRKDWPTTNVLAACSFDLKFTYVLAGWEGTASDSRIIKNALSRRDKLIIPHGKYYLVDSGFMLKRDLITPYRGIRYHLKEYSRCGPTNAKELFNLRHASLRNAIERAFGVLKKRFPIIASGTEPHYELDIRTDIILACCILHNFLMGVDPDERLINEVDRELNANSNNEVSCNERQDNDWREGSMIRDNIANAMWLDYNIDILVQANPSIKKWKYTPVPHYEKLLELFAHDRANGQGASTAAERNVEIILEEEQRDLDLDDEPESFEMVSDSPSYDRSKKRKCASVDSYGSKKNSVIDINVKEVIAAIDRSNSVIENRSFRQQKVNEQLYKDLVCAGVPDKHILGAYLFLGENKEKMMLFMGCPPEKRLAFLKMIFPF